MKKITVFLLALFSALSLSACGKETPAPETNLPSEGNPAAETQQMETQQTESLPTAEVEITPSGKREANVELSACLEGTEEKKPATLFTGDGYSLYILDEGWWFESELEDGVPVESWENQSLDNTELSVLRLTGKTVEEAKTIIRLDEDDYALTEDDQGNLSGEDPMDQSFLTVRFYAGDGVTYVVRTECPTGALEGLGMWLSAMAETFQLSE